MPDTDTLSAYEQATNMAATIQSSKAVDDVSVEGMEGDDTVRVVVDNGNKDRLEGIEHDYVRRQDETAYFSFPSFERLIITIRD